MATKDISRFLFQPEKHYSGVRLQQGRVITDGDFNEGERIDDEEQRVIVVDVVGNKGSPDEGFAISNPAPDPGPYDFDIHVGVYYLGGLRFTLEGRDDDTVGFNEQDDWLQQNRVGELPAPPVLPGVDEIRHDLVYLVGWEQPVTAVEDRELRERALGGPDTGVRIRRMRRVYVRPGDDEAESSCALAFGALVGELTSDGHEFDTRHCELRSGVRLAVSAGQEDVDGDLCTPAVVQGYLGAENQAIRVEVIAPDRFLWGYDNASPLYRIESQISLDGNNSGTLTFQTPPRDQAHHPLPGQVVEILPWGARLSNDEIVADHQIAPDIGGGVFARVTAPYDPSAQTLTVTVEDPTTLDNMKSWVPPEGDPFFFLRVWNPGDDVDVDPVIGIQIGVDPIPLAGTGLVVTFTNTPIVGDYWILAARPSTPDIVVPWDLWEGEAAPHGPRRFYAPLALVHWDGPDDVSAESCRKTFRPLTEQSHCCTFTVGDGARSFGDFRSINEALAALPPDGGKVCVLPGTYDTELVLASGLTNVVIEGCGAQSIIKTPAGNSTITGLVSVVDCQGLTLRELTIEATGQFGVQLRISDGAEEDQKDIRLERVTVRTYRDDTLPVPPVTEPVADPDESSPFPLTALDAIDIEGLIVEQCTLAMAADFSAYPVVHLSHAKRVLLERNEITVLDTLQERSGVRLAYGGVHIAQACSYVELRRNLILGGLGVGVCFGAVEPVPDEPPPVGGPGDLTSGLGQTPFWPPGGFVIVDGEDCPGNGGIVPPDFPFVANDPPATQPGLPNEFISLVENMIREMGSSGVSVMGFWAIPADPVELEVYPMHIVDDLVVRDNTIVKNYRKPAEPVLPGGAATVAAFGGIVLADSANAKITGNTIEDNGEIFVNPTVGIYILYGENLVIESNQIRRNGPMPPDVESQAITGNRAGIAIQLAGRRILNDPAGGGTVVGAELESAARIRGNIVEQPAGRSLQLYGLGPMAISDNYLVSQGLAGVDPPEVLEQGHAVEIANFGVSPDLEIIEGMIPPPNLALVSFLRQPTIQGNPGGIPAADLFDGRIEYSHNQVRLATGESASFFITWAVLIASRGDVGVTGNQHTVTRDPTADSMLTATSVWGLSTRVNDNRFTEHPITSDATGASAISLGWLNVTAHNVATSCVIGFTSSGVATNVEDGPNKEFITGSCETLQSAFEDALGIV